jgi:hypothetical protein
MRGTTLCLVLGGVGAALVVTGSGAAQDVAGSRLYGLSEAASFPEFPLFDAGNRVDGLPLVAALRRDDTAEYVSFVYGDCGAADDQGCAPPVEVQVWPACRRNLALYDAKLPGAPAPERATVRGVPAAFLEDGQRLELQADRSTIVVFGDSRERVVKVAAALRRVGDGPAVEALPSPVPGAVDGRLSC